MIKELPSDIVSHHDLTTGPELWPDVRDTEMRVGREFVAVYEIVLDRLGLRIKEPYTIEQMAILAASVTDGIAIRTPVVPELVFDLASPRNSETWNLLGVGLAAIVTEFVEDGV